MGYIVWTDKSGECCGLIVGRHLTLTHITTDEGNPIRTGQHAHRCAGDLDNFLGSNI